MKHVATYRLIHGITAITLWLACTFSASACTETDMLKLIGTLEGPDGYNDFYAKGAPPPSNLTAMTVDEVLAWQRDIRRNVVSTAAGRYQVIYTTLKDMRDKGVVSGTDRFNAFTQDKIARTLLYQTGYRTGSTSGAVANRIAGIWAALPVVEGPGAGLSYHHGIAGNRAHITADTFRKFLACEIHITEVVLESQALSVATSLSATIEELIEEMANVSNTSIAKLIPLALYILAIFAGVDLVYRLARGIFQGQGLGQLFQDLMFHMLTVGFFILIITYSGEIITAVADVAHHLSEDVTGISDYNIPELIVEKMIFLLQALRAANTMDPVSATLASQFAFLGFLMFCASMTLVISLYVRIFLVATFGIITAGFGAWDATHAIGRSYVMMLASFILQLLVVTYILITLTSIFAQTDPESAPLASGIIFLFFEILGFVLLLTLPPAIGKLVK